MSYASVAAHNAPSPQDQPHADPALLTTPSSQQANPVADDTSKVNVVPSDFKDHLATETSEFTPPVHFGGAKPSGKGSKAHKRVEEAEAEGYELWETVKETVLRPAVAGGLFGVVNVGLLAGASYAYYTEPRLRRDARAIASTVISAFAILGAEGYAADTYRRTPEGRTHERKVREEGSAVYRYAREHVLRPGVLGGLLGLVNVGILSTVGYFAYSNWDRPHWDRRTVSAISVGLLTLWGGEGVVASRSDVRKKIHPKS
ncbi:hypothetical protein BV25DRAFT_323424 [Artomyces pyxidatus]|uniref:Uncharacterized protein n=1 Tax=Artomyces pyxidatus TaxID=48021 RepID=A0ACB8SFI3_9AGAM|nr:hypothetical protein BV25DRAFT_323424 [Artomyces pyxidatus]